METCELLQVARARRLASTGEARQLRLSSGLSIREVASAIGVSSTTLFRWENAQRSPRGTSAAAWGGFLRDLAEQSVSAA